MARQNMPKTGVMQPFIVLNRDAAVAGVFSVDGEAGSIDLTGKYLQISNYNNDMGAINLSLADINDKLDLRAKKGANSDITSITGLTTALSIAQGGTGAKNGSDAWANIVLARTVGLARQDLALNRFQQFDGDTRVVDPNGSRYLFVASASQGGDWGVYDINSSAKIPLPGGSGGTGSTTYAGAWSNIAQFGATATTACRGNDSRLGTIDGKTGGTVSTSIGANGAITAWAVPSNPSNGAFLNAAGVRSQLRGRGANLDSQGAYGVMYMQEWVGNYHSLLFNLNGFSSDYTWQMRAGGQTFSPLGELQYSGSDVRLKSDFEESLSGALDRINKIGSVEFTLNANKRRCRGYVAQQLKDIDTLYTFEGGESTDENGNTFTVLNVDQTAIISDLIASVQTLTQQVKDLQSHLESK